MRCPRVFAVLSVGVAACGASDHSRASDALRSLRSLYCLLPQRMLNVMPAGQPFHAPRMSVTLRGRMVSLALLAIVCVGCLRAQVATPVVPRAVGAALSGEVRADRKGAPVQKARVRLSAPAREWRDSTFSDSQGRFTFGVLAPGEYVLDVLIIGFRRHRETLTLAPDQRAQLRIVLHPDSVSLLSDCVAPDGRSMGPQYCR